MSSTGQLTEDGFVGLGAGCYGGECKFYRLILDDKINSRYCGDNVPSIDNDNFVPIFTAIKPRLG